METPAWLMGVRQPEDVTVRPVVEAPRRCREYAVWYAWAHRNVDDPHRCHLAAQAALEAEDHGADYREAARLAQRAAELVTASNVNLRADARTQNYARWYCWAALELKLEKPVSHRAAYAATRAAEAGAGPKQAIEAALQAVGRTDIRTSWQDWLSGGPLSIASGVVCLLALITLPIHLPILPVLGTLYALRTMTGANRFTWPAAAVGLVLNGTALAIAAATFLQAAGIGH